jgi:MAF protein
MKSTERTLSVILASASPRRRELLALLGIPFQVRTANVDEMQLTGESPAQMAARLAQTKALAVRQAVDGLIIAADTLVVLGDEVLGKPSDANDATTMLKRLRGRAHRVLTGFALLCTDSEEMRTCVTATDVWMAHYADEKIAAYVESGDPMDKAGAYAIQSRDFAPVERLDGCPANVMGLPVCRVERALRAMGVVLRTTPVAACCPARSVCAIHYLVIPG